MGVDVEGNRRGRVAQALTDDLDRDAGLQELAGVGVPKIMEPNGQAVLPNEAAEI